MKKKEWVFTNDLEDRRTYLVEVDISATVYRPWVEMKYPWQRK